MNCISFLRIIHLRFIKSDCENIVLAIFGKMGNCNHFICKLESYCNQYNNEKTKNQLNWEGLLKFVMSLDNQGIAQFNMYMQNEFNTNPA